MPRLQKRPMYRACDVLMAVLLGLQTSHGAATLPAGLHKGIAGLKRRVGDAGGEVVKVAQEKLRKRVQQLKPADGRENGTTGFKQKLIHSRARATKALSQLESGEGRARARVEVEAALVRWLARRGLTPVDAKNMAVMFGTVMGLMGLSAVVGGAVRHELMVAAAPMDVATFEGQVSLNPFAMPSEGALAEVGIRQDPTAFHDAKTFVANQAEISQLLGTRLNLTQALSTLEVLDKLTSYSDGGPYPRHIGEIYSANQSITLMVNPEALGKLHAFDTLVAPSLRHGVEAGLFQGEPGIFDYEGSAAQITGTSTDDKVLKEQLLWIPRGFMSQMWPLADVGLTTMSRDLGNGTMDLGRISLNVVMPSIPLMPLPEPVTMSQANATQQFFEGYNVTRSYAIASSFASGAGFGQGAQQILINATGSNAADVPRIVGDSPVVTSVAAR